MRKYQIAGSEDGEVIDQHRHPQERTYIKQGIRENVTEERRRKRAMEDITKRETTDVF